MIIFFENGRLGNQLFQYSGLKYYFPDHKLVLFGFENLQTQFNKVYARCIPKKSLTPWISIKLLRMFFNLLVVVRVVGRITEEVDGDRFEVVKRRGLIWNLLVAQDIYFQHSSFVDNLKLNPILNFDLIKSATEWLNKKNIDLNESCLTFVHIRRGDYLSWPSQEYPAVLDISWYQNAIDYIKAKQKNSVFIVMGDDQNYIRQNFEESNGLTISSNSPEIDLALMSLCNSGVLSASSFAWWGAYLSRLYKRSQSKNNNHLYIAPKYWFGHRRNRWHPEGFKTKWLNYL